MQKLFLIFFILSLNSICHSQVNADSTDIYIEYKRGINYTVKMRSGDVYTGFVKEETTEFIILENRLTHNSVELRKSEIVRRTQPKERDLSSELLGENLHAKNYLLLTSAFLFDKNTATTNSHWLLVQSIDYAFSENWAISLNTLAFYPVTLGVKCAYLLSDNNYLGANIFVIGDVTSGSSGSILFGYGALGKFTKGSSNKNITLSGGILGLNSGLFYTYTTKPFVNLGFVSAAYCNRFSKRVALNFEGWYLPEVRTGIGGIGFKFVGDETTCWTVGCYTLLNNYDNTLKLNLKTIPIPYFGVARKFN